MEKYLGEYDLKILIKTIEQAYAFIKGGPAPQLEVQLLDQLDILNSILNRNGSSEDTVVCPVCDFECNHLVTTIRVSTQDYKITEFIIDDKYHVPVDFTYTYHSQGNLHLLFTCESGHYFIKSFDGHKGTVFVDSNPLMDELASTLNSYANDSEQLDLSFSFNLLGKIERFLNKKTDDFFKKNFD